MAKYIGNSPSSASQDDASGGYTVNGKLPDENGNFEVTAEELNAALIDHVHTIADVDMLQETLDNKADRIHAHDYVTGIEAEGNVLGGVVTLKGAGDITLTPAGSTIVVTANAPSQTVTQSVNDARDGTTAVKTFVGTQAEWDAFTPDGTSQYLVYIHS